MRVALRIARGDITRWKADAITTSANAGLCGNRTPAFWRFALRPDNVDGAVHAAAGAELADSLANLASAQGFQMPCGPSGIDAVRTPWRGAVLPQSTGGRVACMTGQAVITPSFGSLTAYTSCVVHAVAPDGMFRSGLPGAAEHLVDPGERGLQRELDDGRAAVAADGADDERRR